MNVIRRKTINLIFSIFVLFGIASTIMDPLIPVISEKLGIGYDKISLMLLAGSIFGIISIYISGRFCDKYNLKKIIITGMIFSAAGLALFAAYLNFAVLILVIILLRLGHGILDPSIHTYASNITEGGKSSIFLKLDSFWYLGAILSPLMIGLTLLLNIDLKFVFVFFVILYLVLTLFFYKISPVDHLSLAKNPDRNLRVDQIINTVNKHCGAGNFDNNKTKVTTLLKKPVIIIAAIAIFFNIGIIANLSTWLTTYFTALGIQVSIGSMILSFYWIFSILGLFITNRAINKIGELNSLFIFAAAGTISTVVYSFVPNSIVKILFLFFQAIFYSGIFPITIAIAVNESIENSGTIIGICLAVGSSSSIVLLPLIGYLAQYYGKEYIAYVILLIAILGLIFVAILFKLLGKKYKNKRPSKI